MTDRHPVKEPDDEKDEKARKDAADRRHVKDRHAETPEPPAIEDAGPMTVVLLEQPDGTTVSADVPYPPGSQQIYVDGKPYYHTAEDGDLWVYRPL